FACEPIGDESAVRANPQIEKRRPTQGEKGSNLPCAVACELIESERSLLIQGDIAPVRGIKGDPNSVFAAAFPFLGRFDIRQDESRGGFVSQLRSDADMGCFANGLQALEPLAYPPAGPLGGGPFQPRSP